MTISRRTASRIRHVTTASSQEQATSYQQRQSRVPPTPCRSCNSESRARQLHRPAPAYPRATGWKSRIGGYTPNKMTKRKPLQKSKRLLVGGLARRQPLASQLPWPPLFSDWSSLLGIHVQGGNGAAPFRVCKAKVHHYTHQKTRPLPLLERSQPPTTFPAEAHAVNGRALPPTQKSASQCPGHAACDALRIRSNSCAM